MPGTVDQGRAAYPSDIGRAVGRKKEMRAGGKTTTIRMLLGLVRPTSGSGTILGGSLADPASYLDKVGALIEAPAFYPQLSGRENLKALARLGRPCWPVPSC